MHLWTLGCHALGELSDGAEAFRFQTLIALIISSQPGMALWPMPCNGYACSRALG